MDEPSVAYLTSVAVIQGEVQRKFGRCLLRAQQYERALKNLIPLCSLSGPFDQFQAIQDEKIAWMRTQTLGTLVRLLTQDYLTLLDAREEHLENTLPSVEGLRYRQQLPMSAEQLEATKISLKEFVELRNELVHHFIERFDLNSVSGCTAADLFLDESYETINRHALTLREWMKSWQEVRAAMVIFLESQACENLFDGINPCGSIK